MHASVHWRTPSLTVNDGRGLPIRQIGYLRSVAGEPAIALITRQGYDVTGRNVTQQDPRLTVPNLVMVHGLGGQVLKVDSVDAGWRLNLPGLAGEPLERWDERCSHWRTTFDTRLRVVTVEENGQADVDIFTYADATADSGQNRRGQLLAQKDASGTLHMDSYGLLGQPLRETRTFVDGEAFTSQRIFSPLGAVLEQTDAGGHQQQSRYGLTGHLKQVRLRLSGNTDWQPVIFDIRLNAAGQITEQHAGNEVISQWTYDPANGRLRSQSSRKGSDPVLQSFEYSHDRVGNITRIEDHTFQTVHYANQVIDGHRDFTYDSLYRLTRATGYDDSPLSDIPGLPQPTDPKKRLNYTQTYQYDNAGNLLELRHVRADASYTRQMRMDANSNRGVRWQPTDPEPDFDQLFDRHGNLLAVQPGQPLKWNARDELQSVTRIHREDGRADAEHYHYSAGARVFKRHETFAGTTGHFHQVRYLPGLEIRTKDNGEELHVISAGSARCLHWVKNPPSGVQRIQLRYSLFDHLGSCVMELDEHAKTISHEGYYPFGATAWLAAKSAIEVSYKFARYSGKEMDTSGLYYYGERYYAPWLQRWINPDPSGSIDGLNLYCMTGNDPINFIDRQGTTRTAAQTVTLTISPDPSTPPESVSNPRDNPPPLPPPEPSKPWKLRARDTARNAANSRVGLALLPTGGSSPATGAMVAAMVASVGQVVVHSTLFNPGWSPPGSWDPATGGGLPPAEVTQDANRMFNQINVAATLAATLAGAVLGPIVGGYVDDLRDTQNIRAKNAKAEKMIDRIDGLIAEHRVMDQVSRKAQNALRDQVLEVEELTGITWDSMNQLEKIGRLRPLESAVDVSTQTVAVDRQVRLRVPMKARKLAKR